MSFLQILSIRWILSILFVTLVLVSGIGLDAQVTTSTLYGVVRDATGAVLPGVMVTATNQGSNLSRETVTDERGDFTLLVLPTGRYTLKLELPGFKTYSNEGLELGAGQTVRQTFVLEVGQLSESITVAESAPLVQTASAAQQESFGTADVTELPLARRSVTSLLNLSTGAFVNGTTRNIMLNGVGAGGASITVDGTDAAANPETRSVGAHGFSGSQNQVDVMSIEAMEEVQIIKGVMPAEYGGFTGGQVNMITRSGTNQFHGSAFENHQNGKFFATDPFLRTRPNMRFNQFGGALGGPIVRNRVMFFTAFEGYREKQGVMAGSGPGSGQSAVVPTQQLRDRIFAALPFPETKIVLDSLPLPNVPVDADVGRFVGSRDFVRRDNQVIAKGDVLIFNGNLSGTFSRQRPYTLFPTYNVGDYGNDTIVPNSSDRMSTQYVLARRSWVSESRFGWNRNNLPRTGNFWQATDPSKPPVTDRLNVQSRVPSFAVTGAGFSTPLGQILDFKSYTLNIDQKFSRVMGRHNVKTGFRWLRQVGSKSNPSNPIFSFSTIQDLLANNPSSILVDNGKPPHTGHLDEYGAFIQDDWRVNNKLVLNLGLRYDYYATIRIRSTTDQPAEIVNLEPPTDLRKMDFGAFRDPDKPYDPDRLNLGPRFGFAWTLDQNGRTVVRGGSAVLYSSHLYMTIENAVSDPTSGSTAQWNGTEAAAKNIKWPRYARDLNAIVARDAVPGKKIVQALFDTQLPNPYTIQTMVSLQRSFGSVLMAEAAYVHTDGRNFPLHLPLVQAFDRATGARPNPLLGSASGHYVKSSQTTVYNALQASVRKPFSGSWSFDLHYTLSKGWADQGGALNSFFTNPGAINMTQDFWNPEADRSPLTGEVRHRITGNAIYALPWFKNRGGVASHILGGWEISSILSIRSGSFLTVTQPSGIPNSRPDYVGANPVFADWSQTLRYTDKAAFALVPTYPTTRATIRPGTANPSQLTGPGSWTVDMTMRKTFKITESVSLQVRADAFNLLNHVNYGNPNGNITSATFGLITSAGTPRQVQFGVRLAF